MKITGRNQWVSESVSRVEKCKCALLQRIGHKLEQGFRGGIVGQAKALVEFGVVGLAGSEAFDGNAGTFQDGLEALGLGAGVRMIGHVEDEERRNAFVPGYVIDG